jgi:OOP family OmpA-OmpF porin
MVEGSQKTLAAIGELLEAVPEMKVAVVGHTDAEGSHEVNLELSKRRRPGSQ